MCFVMPVSRVDYNLMACCFDAWVAAHMSILSEVRIFRTGGETSCMCMQNVMHVHEHGVHDMSFPATNDQTVLMAINIRLFLTSWLDA